MMPVGRIQASEFDAIIDGIGDIRDPVFVLDIVEGLDFAYPTQTIYTNAGE